MSSPSPAPLALLEIPLLCCFFHVSPSPSYFLANRDLMITWYRLKNNKLIFNNWSTPSEAAISLTITLHTNPLTIPEQFIITKPLCQVHRTATSRRWLHVLYYWYPSFPFSIPISPTCGLRSSLSIVSLRTVTRRTSKHRCARPSTWINVISTVTKEGQAHRGHNQALAGQISMGSQISIGCQVASYLSVTKGVCIKTRRKTMDKEGTGAPVNFWY